MPPAAPGPRCTICRRPTDQPICTVCRTDADTNLAKLPQLAVRLHLQLAAAPLPIPGRPPGRAALSTRTAANPTALAMTATTTAVLVWAHTTVDTPEPGLISIPTWIATWAGLWRTREDHHTPLPRRTQRTWSQLTWNPPTPARQIPGGARDEDPLIVAWEDRFGLAPALPLAVHDDWRYLRTWLPNACDHYPDTPTFATQLRHLVGVALAAVGEPSEVVYLGDCPEPIIDPSTGWQAITFREPTADEPADLVAPIPRFCGARITHSPNDGDTVTCPNCRTKTDKAGWYQLALRMRERWGHVGARENWQR